MAKAGKKKSRVAVKDMKFRNDPMIRLYDKAQDWLQERGRPLVIAVGVIAGLIIIYLIGSTFFSWRDSKAAAEFAKAFAKYNAPVQDSQVTTTPTTSALSYTDEKLKWQETADAFERLANDYPGYYGAIGRYYAGVAYLHFDREKGLQLLQEAINKNEHPTADLARLAIAENYLVNDETDKAISEYEKLLGSSADIKLAVKLGLARAYEKIGETEKAVDAYIEVAKTDRSSPAGSEAEKRISALAPDRLKEVPPPDPTLPPGF